MTVDEYRGRAAELIGVAFTAITGLVALTAEFASSRVESPAPLTSAPTGFGNERLFTQAELDRIVKDRLTQQARAMRARPQLSGAIAAPIDTERKDTTTCPTK